MALAVLLPLTSRGVEDPLDNLRQLEECLPSPAGLYCIVLVGLI